MTVDKDASQSVIARATAQFNSGQSTTTRSNTNDTIHASTSNEAAKPESGGGITRSSSPALTPSQRAQIQFQEQNQAREAQNQTKELADYGTMGIVYGQTQKNAQYKYSNPQTPTTDKEIEALARRRGISEAQIRADLTSAEPAVLHTSAGGGPTYQYPSSAKTQYQRELSQIAGKQEFWKQHQTGGMLERTSATITYPPMEDKPLYPMNMTNYESYSVRPEVDLKNKETEFRKTLETSGLNREDREAYLRNYEAYKKQFENASKTDLYNVTTENPQYAELREQARAYQRVEDSIGAIRPDKMAYSLQEPIWNFKETRQPNTTYYSDVKLFGQTVFRADVTNWDKFVGERPKSSADIIIEGYGRDMPKTAWAIKTADQAVGDYLDAQTQLAKSTGGREGKIQAAELGVSFVSNIITAPVAAGSFTGKALGKAAFDWGVGFGLASPIAERAVYEKTGSRELATVAGLVAGAGTIGVGEAISKIHFRNSLSTDYKTNRVDKGMRDLAFPSGNQPIDVGKMTDIKSAKDVYLKDATQLSKGKGGMKPIYPSVDIEKAMWQEYKEATIARNEANWADRAAAEKITLFDATPINTKQPYMKPIEPTKTELRDNARSRAYAAYNPTTLGYTLYGEGAGASLKQAPKPFNFDFSSDITSIKPTKYGEKIAAGKVTAFESSSLQVVRKPTPKTKTIKTDNGLMLLQKEEPILKVEQETKLQPKQEVMPILRAIDNMRQSQTQAQKTSLRMGQISWSGYNIGQMFDVKQAQKQDLGYITQTQKLRQDLGQTLIPAQQIEQLPRQNQAQRQTQQQIQRQETIQRTDLRLDQRQMQIPELVIPEPFKTPPPPLWLPGGGSNPLRKRGGGFKSGYRNTLRHPIMTPAQVNQILYPTRGRR